jgi:hypothetical protein
MTVELTEQGQHIFDLVYKYAEDWDTLWNVYGKKRENIQLRGNLYMAILKYCGLHHTYMNFFAEKVYYEIMSFYGLDSIEQAYKYRLEENKLLEFIELVQLHDKNLYFEIHNPVIF